jgi:hypothetical protein
MKIIKLTIAKSFSRKETEVYVNENHIISFHESPYAGTRVHLTETSMGDSAIDVLESVEQILKTLTQS